MRLVVTGGLGFIGSHVVEAATRRGHEVVVVDRRSVAEAAAQPDCADLPAALAAAAAVEQGDVGDAAVIGPLLAGCDAVLHLAARVGLGDGVADAVEYVADNDMVTAVLLAAMAGSGVPRLVLASSMVVYGPGQGRCPEHGPVQPANRTVERLTTGDFEARCPLCDATVEPMLVDEACPLAPANVYAASKVAQEHLCASWARSTGGAATALRFHNVYGRRLPDDTPYAGVAALFLSMLRRRRRPTVFEDGGQRRDFVQVRDVAAAVVAAAEARAWNGRMRAFNIGSEHPRTVLDLASALSRATDGPPPLVTGEFRLGDVRHITASSAAATAALDWEPTVPFVDGIAELAAARA